MIGDSPFTVFQRRDRQAKFELQCIFRMKVATAVSPHDLELSIHRFNEVGGGEGFPHVLGIFQERQIVLPFLAELADPRRIGLGESIAEFFKLAVADFDVPAGFDGAPPLLKLNGIGFGKMSLGIALHVNGAELDVGVGKETLADGHQTREVVLNENQHTSESAFN